MLWQNFMFKAFINSKDALVDGLFILTFEIFAKLFFRVVKVQTDIVGVIFPEVGRIGRRWGQELPSTDTHGQSGGTRINSCSCCK
jgi:hypothetical protein